MRLLAPVLESGWLARRAVGWIDRQRRLHRPLAEPIPDVGLARLARFFQPETLEPIRVQRVSRVEPPTGFGLLGRLPPLALDFDRVYGITFVDTILVAEGLVPEAARPDCLFHECVHVAQYRLLGVEEFVRRYLTGWAAAGYRYDAIPLERQAYQLQRWFAADPDRPFSVEAEVSQALGVRRAVPQ